MNSPQERLEYYINMNFSTKAEFCRKIGMRTDSLNKYLGNYKNIMGMKYRDKLIDVGLNYDWYVKGKGEMLVQQNKEIGNPQPLGITPSNELPEQARQTIYSSSRYTLREMLMPEKLLELSPNLVFFNISSVEDLPQEEIERLKQRNIDVINKLFENVSDLREKYERNQIDNTKLHRGEDLILANDIVERVENLPIEQVRVLNSKNIGKTALQNKEIEILAE